MPPFSFGLSDYGVGGSFFFGGDSTWAAEVQAARYRAAVVAMR